MERSLDYARDDKEGATLEMTRRRGLEMTKQRVINTKLDYDYD
jgi:hypothetical protein